MRVVVRRLALLVTVGAALRVAQRWWRSHTDPPSGPTPAAAWPPILVPPAPVPPARVPPGVAEMGGPAVPREGDGPEWREPADGACPDGFPVKAKGRSRLYHVPGMAAYARTTPDRCYRSEADAESDGFTRAKR